MGFVVPTAFLTSDPCEVGQMSGFDYNQFLKEFDFVASIPGAAKVSQPKAVEPARPEEPRQIDAGKIEPKDFSELPAKLRRTINEIRIQHGKEPLKEPLLIDSKIIEELYGKREECIYLMKNKFIKSLKVGMTGRREGRFRELEKQGWELVDTIETREFPAQRLEKIALSTARIMGAKMGEEAFTHYFEGWTECWTIETYPVESLKQIFIDFQSILSGLLSTGLPFPAKINSVDA